MSVLTFTIQIVGVTYDIKEGSFDFNPQVEQRTKLKFTVLDPTNVFSFQKGQQVTLTDSASTIKFTGTVHTSLRYRVGDGTMIFHDIDCNDMHQVADERTTNRVYNGQNAGVIVAGMVNDTIASEGVTANYAIRDDNTQAEFSQGVLSGLVATPNLGGDLELAPAGSDVIIIENTTAIFNTGTLTNVTAANNQLTLTPTSSIKMQCVQSLPGNAHSYCYVRFDMTALTITNLGSFLSYDIWIDPASPEHKFGVDIWFTDGTQLSNNFVYTDSQNLSPHPETDLSSYASGQWYHRQFYLINFSGKAVSSINFACGGQKVGTYTAYIKNVNYLNNDFSFNHTFFNGTNFNYGPAVTITSGYQYPLMSIVNTYDSGTISSRYTPAYSIDAAKILRSSFVSWKPNLASGVSFAVYYSIDGGASYQLCTNNAPLPNLPVGMSLAGKTIIFSVIFTPGSVIESTPVLTFFECVLQSSYVSSKVDVLYGANWGTGTPTNTVGNGAILNLIGALRNWANGDTSNQPLFGNSSPSSRIQTSFFTITTGAATNDAKSQMVFAGQYTDQVIDIDLFVQVFQLGFCYRTTFWGNLQDTYAYVAFITTTTVVLGRGTNNGTGGFTLIATVTVALTAGDWHHLQVVVVGNVHTVILDGITYISSTDGTFPGAGYVGLRIWNNTGVAQTGFFRNFGVMKVLTGTWVSPSTSIAAAVTYGNSLIWWSDASTAASTILVEVSQNGGSTYATCTNGQPLPGFSPGGSLSGISLLFRITLMASAANVMPGITFFNVYVLGQFSSTGTRISPVLSLSPALICGNATANWNVVTPPNTSFALATSLDNITYNGIFGLLGAQIAGLTTQPLPVLDTFAVDDHTGYTHLQRTGGSTSTWVWDTANSRVTATGGTNDMQLFAGVWFNLNYQVKKQIVIDHTKVIGGVDLTNYPLLVSFTDPNLVIPTGFVQNTSGFDIIFVDATETTQLNHEIERYNIFTGEIEMHVMIPTLSHTVDTVIYMYFCNPSIVTTQEHITATWNANFKGVWHMSDSAANTTVKDSTGVNNGTSVANTNTKTVQGEISNALSFNGINDHVSVTGLMGSPSSITVTAWANLTSGWHNSELVTLGDHVVLRLDNTGTSTDGIYYDGSAYHLTSTNKLYAGQGWHKFTYIIDGVGHTQTMMVDGVQIAQSSVANAISYAGLQANTIIGTHAALSAFQLNGNIDEVRISNVARSQGWDTTEYNNQSSPGTFLSLGTLTFQPTTSTKDVDLIFDTDQADQAGVVWRQTDASNFYELDIFDASSSAGSTNVLQLYKVVANVKTQIGATTAISFVRGTAYRARVTMIGTAISVYFDSVAPVLTASDSALAGPGKFGMINVSGNAHFYNFRMQPLGQSLAGVNLWSKVTLGSNDPQFTPQLTDLTLVALHPNIALGPQISTADYQRTYFSANMDDIAKKADWTWQIDPSLNMLAGPRIALPAPWILTDKDVLFPDDGSTSLSVENSGDLYRNRQILKGVLATQVVNETHVGDGKSTSWSLKFPVVGNPPTISVNNQPKTIGQKGIDTGKDFYYALNSTSLAQDVSGVILQPIVDSFTISYTGQFTTEAVRNNIGGFPNTTSQSQYAALTGGSGIVENVEDVTAQQLNMVAANAYGDSLLQKYGVIGRTLIFKTNRTGLQVGQYLAVFMPEHKLNDAAMLITAMDLQPEITLVGNQASMLYYWQVTCIEGPNLGSWQKTLVQTLGYNPSSRSY